MVYDRVPCVRSRWWWGSSFTAPLGNLGAHAQPAARTHVTHAVPSFPLHRSLALTRHARAHHCNHVYGLCTRSDLFLALCYPAQRLAVFYATVCDHAHRSRRSRSTMFARERKHIYIYVYICARGIDCREGNGTRKYLRGTQKGGEYGANCRE